MWPSPEEYPRGAGPLAPFEPAESVESDFLNGGKRVANMSELVNGSVAGKSALLDCECWGCGVLLVEVRDGDSIRYGESEPGVREPPKPGCEFKLNGRDARSICERECIVNEL